jgi:hypothetical protein
MMVGERERFDHSGAVLVGLRAPDSHVGTVEAIAPDVAAFQRDEFAAPECTGVTNEQ